MTTSATQFSAVPPAHDILAVSEALFHAGAAFDGFTSQMRRAFELNAHERLALAALWSTGPMTMTELGAWIPLSRAAVTTLVDRMEQHGLVRRSSDATDRRRTVVQITQSATDRMLPVVEHWGVDVANLVGALGDEAWAIVHRFLMDFRELNLRQAERLKALSDEEIQALARP